MKIQSVYVRNFMGLSEARARAQGAAAMTIEEAYAARKARAAAKQNWQLRQEEPFTPAEIRAIVAWAPAEAWDALRERRRYHHGEPVLGGGHRAVSVAPESSGLVCVQTTYADEGSVGWHCWVDPDMSEDTP
jgi:hypothetical protein